MNNYKLEGRLVEEVPVVGNLLNDELGNVVIKKVNERFNGVQGIGLPEEFFVEGQPITHGNVVRTILVDQILNELGADAHVITSGELVGYRSVDRNTEPNHVYSSDLVIAPQNGSFTYNAELRKEVLELIDRADTEVPLIVSGLAVEREDNRE